MHVNNWLVGFEEVTDCCRGIVLAFAKQPRRQQAPQPSITSYRPCVQILLAQKLRGCLEIHIGRERLIVRADRAVYLKSRELYPEFSAWKMHSFLMGQGIVDRLPLQSLR